MKKRIGSLLLILALCFTLLPTAALASVGVHISRRTVAKYRAELNIPTAAARKRDSRNRT